MQKKQFVLLSAIPILVILMAVLATAVTLNTPIPAGNYTGTMIVNCTTTPVESTDALNATIFYSSTGGATNTILTTVVSGYANDTDFTSSVALTGLSATATYNFSCRVRSVNGTINSTGTYNTASAGITVDNTAPTVILSVTPTRISTGRTIDYKCMIADNLDTGTALGTTLTVTKPDATVTNLTTLGVNPANYMSFTDTSADGTYTFSCDATDHTTNSPTAESTSVTASLSGYAKTEDGGQVLNGGQQPTNFTPALVIIGIVLLIWWANRKK